MVRGYLPARWRNMILPDGAMELMINLGDPQKLCARDNPAKHTIFRQSWSGSEGSELIIDTDSPQQQRWSMRRHERSVLRKTFRTVDSKL
jgi:hypothetical protein